MVESATIQAHPLSAFELTPLQNAVSSSSTSPSTTIMDMSWQSSPAASEEATTTAFGSPGVGGSRVFKRGTRYRF
ncbi:unnamed protein product [Phytophthora fragariaefolia]|uniref:Unnamed protein product n=1 Tax=Phytophthora fragariaefolia TaxID=1490495 RepID=A0A9W7CNS6_9STRA|nr:unnamed protein product [Phytophthora fragariaefolia]